MRWPDSTSALSLAVPGPHPSIDDRASPMTLYQLNITPSREFARQRQCSISNASRNSSRGSPKLCHITLVKHVIFIHINRCRSATSVATLFSLAKYTLSYFTTVDSRSGKLRGRSSSRIASESCWHLEFCFFATVSFRPLFSCLSAHLDLRITVLG